MPARPQSTNPLLTLSSSFSSCIALRKNHLLQNVHSLGVGKSCSNFVCSTPESRSTTSTAAGQKYAWKRNCHLSRSFQRCLRSVERKRWTRPRDEGCDILAPLEPAVD